MSTRSSLAEEIDPSNSLATQVFPVTSAGTQTSSTRCHSRGSSPTPGPAQVYIRLVFVRIGEIDTLKERYEAQIAIESRWPADLQRLSANISSNEQKRLVEGKSISLVKYAESDWHPQLYIENALGDLEEKKRYTAKKSKDDEQIYICEHRDVKGVFWEKLELQHFPSDVQDLSISIGSMFHNDKVLLTKDPYHPSGVIREAFIDQQEWSLYEHVDTEQQLVKEFLSRGEIDEEDDDGDHLSESEDRKRSVLTVTCHAARQSNYYFWNGYSLIFMITVVSFCLFAIPPHLAPNRIQASCTLLLTSITFRWTVNRSLPTISYLTSMDKYAIMCIFILIILCLWHTVMSALVFTLTANFRVTPDMWLARLDRYVCLTALGAFLITHLMLITWLYFVPLKYRRDMLKRDMGGCPELLATRNGKSRRWSRSRRLSLYTHVRIES